MPPFRESLPAGEDSRISPRVQEIRCHDANYDRCPFAEGGGRVVEVTKDTTILAILEGCPEARQIFAALGLRCVGCLGAEQETVETSARMHGLTVAEILEALRSGVQKPGNEPAGHPGDAAAQSITRTGS